MAGERKWNVCFFFYLTDFNFKNKLSHDNNYFPSSQLVTQTLELNNRWQVRDGAQFMTLRS